jgi:hypothetical protein
MLLFSIVAEMEPPRSGFMRSGPTAFPPVCASSTAALLQQVPPIDINSQRRSRSNSAPRFAVGGT